MIASAGQTLGLEMEMAVARRDDGASHPVQGYFARLARIKAERDEAPDISRIGGRDVAVSVVDLEGGPVALPPVEIATDGGRYDYDARYTTDEAVYFVPARLSSETLADLQAAAVEAHTTLGLRDLSRTDIIIDADGPVFIETNVAPGMTETSLVPLAVEAAELDFGELCAALVRQAHVRGGGTSQG